MKNKIRMVVGLSALCVSVVACAQHTHSNNGSTYADKNQDLQTTQMAQTKLVEAASSVSQSLYKLAEIEQAAYPPNQLVAPPDPSTYGMDGLASIDWAGPIEPLLQRIAKATDYKLNVLGVEPAVPIIVSMMKKNAPLAEILRDAGLQAQHRANVVVFPSTRTIELRYAAA